MNKTMCTVFVRAIRCGVVTRYGSLHNNYSTLHVWVGVKSDAKRPRRDDRKIPPALVGFVRLADLPVPRPDPWRRIGEDAGIEPMGTNTGSHERRVREEQRLKELTGEVPKRPKRATKTGM